MKQILRVFYHLRSLLILTFVFTIWPIFILPITIYHATVIFIARKARPDLGKIFTSEDTVLEENCIDKEDCIPRCSLVSSIELEGSITLAELRSLFQLNVIEKREAPQLKGNVTSSPLRYPELQQYPVSFMGFKFWKTDHFFDVSDHIVEKVYKNDQPNLSLLHQEMINKSSIPRKSPWELVLVNNYKRDGQLCNESYSNAKSLIIARFHHSMADAKSLLKLFVECLGDQSLSTAQPQPQPPNQDGFLLSLKKRRILILKFLTNWWLFWTHQWKIPRWNRTQNELKPQIVRLSPTLSLNDIKEIGKKNGGTGASVILAIISGSIQRLGLDIGKINAGYILPKDNHPKTLCNHATAGSLHLPTDETNPERRLYNCHENFKILKSSNADKFTERVTYHIGKFFSPMRKIFFRELSTGAVVGITNIAGEAKGFAVGGRNCSEFILSVGTLSGDQGIAFCVSSYKNYLRIAVISKGGVLPETEMEKLANGMEKELQVLRRLCCK